MEKRIRSPNYPALSLPEAVEKIHMIYRAQHTHGAPREVVAKGMGYTGLNGASATAVSALAKYGLLTREGEDWRVSDRAMRIIAPHSAEEKAEAVREAANEPQLFNEIAEKFPGKMPSEDVLRNYLVRNGFAPGALTAVISAYKETSEMVLRETGGYDSPSQLKAEELPMHAAPTQVPVSRDVQPRQNSLELNNLERQIGRYDFEGDQYVRVIATKDIDTEEALDMVEIMIDLKRKELARKKARVSAAAGSSIANDENEQ